MKLTVSQKILYALIKTPKIGRIKGVKIAEIADLSSSVGYLNSIKELPEYDIIKATLKSTDYDAVERKIEQGNITVVSVVDEEYPKALLPYKDKPLLLYCKGDVSLLNRPSLAVIGTRAPTRYGIRATEEFVTTLAKRFVIVSGMARGIDSYAHRSTLSVGGKTVAVLGSGVDIPYPPENKELYDDIIENGLVISEYEPGTEAVSYNFPARNRIISGMARAVLVTEAGEKSGTMITMNNAIAQGKTIFCVPGSIFSEKSDGTNRSIRECQSRAVVRAEDIYDEMGIQSYEIKKRPQMQLDINQQAILRALQNNGEMHVDELLEVVDLNISQLNSLLLRMETVELINKTKHNFWSI